MQIDRTKPFDPTHVLRRERESAKAPKTELKAAQVLNFPRAEPAPASKAVQPIVVEVKPRPRLTFLGVVRDDQDAIVGLRPEYGDD